MKIAIEGCAHGELETIYDTIRCIEDNEAFKVDLLICCGDFQASRNEADLLCMAVPPKYCKICSFYKYYNGEKVAPILTIFIGGNHEASNYLQELPYGGWVAPNIYYLGYAGVINISGIRIGGLSGIYKSNDYMKGHFEHPPYNDNSKRSVYHYRNLEIFRLKQISEPMNIFLSHDWPNGIWEFGNKEQLIRFKPFFEEDINNGTLGSKPLEELLKILKPEYWFAAHLHCKFAAVVPHDCGKKTKFLALDKCLPKRRFLQIVEIPHDKELKTEISYDLEWLTILRLTNHLLKVQSGINYMPGPGSTERWCFQPTEKDKTDTLEIFGENLKIPNNFIKTAVGYSGDHRNSILPHPVSNPQTNLFCKKLSIDDPINLIPNLNINHVEDSRCSSDNNTFIDNSSIQRSALDLPESVNETKEFLRTQAIEQEDNLGKEGEANESQPNKKFKRRNASLYTSESV